MIAMETQMAIMTGISTLAKFILAIGILGLGFIIDSFLLWLSETSVPLTSSVNRKGKEHESLTAKQVKY
jgi:hypothetical protein